MANRDLIVPSFPIGVMDMPFITNRVMRNGRVVQCQGDIAGNGYTIIRAPACAGASQLADLSTAGSRPMRCTMQRARGKLVVKCANKGSRKQLPP